MSTTRLRSALLPLGALAAGFGLTGLSGPTLAQAQNPTLPAPAQATPAAAMAAPRDEAPVATATLPAIKAKATAVRAGRDSVQAVTSRIGKGEQELRDIPQSLTVLTERLIDDRNLDTLKEALHNTAGISFLAAEGGEEDIRLRGYSLQSTGDIFVDGMRDPAFYERDSFNWDRLEVLRGSASMLFGRGSTGGAVNQASKQPLLFGRNEVAVTVGSGNYLRSTADLNLRLGESSALRVNGMLTQADNNGVGARLDKQGLAMVAGIGIGTRHEFQASIYHLKYHDGVNFGLPFLTPVTGSATRTVLPTDPANHYGMASDHSAGGVDMATLGHTWRIAAGTEWRSALRTATYDRDLRPSTIRFAAAGAQPGGQAVTGQNFSENTVFTRGTPAPKIQGMDTVYAQSDLSTKFKALGMNHQVLAGVDAALENFVNFGSSLPTGVTQPKPSILVGTPNDGAWLDPSLRQVFENRSFDAKALGVYAQDLVQITPTWKVLLGLRWDKFNGRYDAPTLTAANGTVTAAAHRARSDALWSKRFGVMWQPTAFQSWHFSYGTSFNTSGDTYQYDAMGSNTDPEGSVNYELGGKLDFFHGKLTVRTALFHAVKTNERNRDAESVSPTTYVLSGQRHAAGFELDIAGRINPAWEVFASYAFIPDAEIDKGAMNAGGTAVTSLQGEVVGSRPGLIPRHSGTVWTTYKLSPHWRVGGGLNARSSMAPQLVTTFTLPSYVTADLMAEYTHEDLSFKLNVSNLSNKHYADMLYRGHYVPGKGRQVQLTGSYRF